MKKSIYAAIIAVSLLTACGGKSGGGGGGDQSTPQAAAEMVFSAARSGDFSHLKDLCDESLGPDGDSKDVCRVATGEDKMKESFKEYFSKGKVVGDPVIEGDRAEVKILFGPDGTKEETFKMGKKDGKWYLMSF